MGSNTFGTIFKMTTWGESHGTMIGVVIDGCPAGVELSEADLQPDLARRAPGQEKTSPRKEPDHAQIVSGVFEGKTTGAPISIIFENRDVDSSPYDAVRNLLKPGHAQATYLAKYGLFDHRGSGRASARETVCRVAAGAVAKKLLSYQRVSCRAWIAQVGIYERDDQMVAALEAAIHEGDSVGGVVAFQIDGLSPGIGDPIYEKLDANLAKAMLSIPATTGFEIGRGFEAATLEGSVHNREAAALLGGITTGQTVIGKVAFKPTSSIKKPQPTTTVSGEAATFLLPENSRHDPCVAIRAVPVVEAMAALVVADAYLLNRCAKL